MLRGREQENARARVRMIGEGKSEEQTGRATDVGGGRDQGKDKVWPDSRHIRSTTAVRVSWKASIGDVIDLDTAATC